MGEQRRDQPERTAGGARSVLLDRGALTDTRRPFALSTAIALLIATLFLGAVFTILFQILVPGVPEIARLAIATDLALALAAGAALVRIGEPWRQTLSLRRFETRLLAPLALVVIGSVTVFSELYVVLQRLLPIPPVLEEELKRLLDLDGGADTVATLVVAILVAPLMEELLFRGALLRGLTASRGPRSAALWTAAFFALFHFYNPWQVLPTFFLGLILAWLVLTTGSLWAAVIVHGAFNGISLLAFRLAPEMSLDAATSVAPWTLVGVVVGLLLGSLALLVGLAWIEQITGGAPFIVDEARAGDRDGYAAGTSVASRQGP